MTKHRPLINFKILDLISFLEANVKVNEIRLMQSKVFIKTKKKKKKKKKKKIKKKKKKKRRKLTY